MQSKKTGDTLTNFKLNLRKELKSIHPYVHNTTKRKNIVCNVLHAEERTQEMKRTKTNILDNRFVMMRVVEYHDVPVVKARHIVKEELQIKEVLEQVVV